MHPLVCRNCGAKLGIVAYLHDTIAIKQILDHPGIALRATRRAKVGESERASAVVG